MGEEFLSLDTDTLIKIISEDKLKSSSEEQVWSIFTISRIQICPNSLLLRVIL